MVVNEVKKIFDGLEKERNNECVGEAKTRYEKLGGD